MVHFGLFCDADQFAEVFASITNEVCVTQDRALLEARVVKVWFAVNHLADKTGFVKVIWIILDDIDCSVTSALDVVVVVGNEVVVLRVAVVVLF